MHSPGRHLLILMLLLSIASACGTTASSTPVAGGAGEAGGNGGVSASKAAAAGPADADSWAADAIEHRGSNGENFEYDCAPGGQGQTAYGTDLYTDDSSVCTAAVHVGAITLADGGTVTIEIQPGWDSYVGSERNGISTSSYGSWPGSFVILTD